MQASQFTVQSYDGGPEYRFFNRLPHLRRAEIELQRDKAYKNLDKQTQAFIKGVGNCILSARAAGLGADLGLPDSLTLGTCEEWACLYNLAVDEAEIPGAEVAEDANPTGTPHGSC